jgi:hypothetical protein
MDDELLAALRLSMTMGEAEVEEEIKTESTAIVPETSDNNIEAKEGKSEVKDEKNIDDVDINGGSINLEVFTFELLFSFIILFYTI